MIAAIRQAYNQVFKQENYKRFLDELDAFHPGALDFRVAETPIFIDDSMKNKILEVCGYIIQEIKSVGFKANTKNAIPEGESFPNQNSIPQCLTFDFGICINENKEYYPALIELQAFPTLYAFQAIYPAVLEKHFQLPDDFSSFFSGLNKNSYILYLKDISLNNYDPQEVILLEIKPHQQKTRIDFYLTQQLTGIRTVCITEIQSEGNKLFYLIDGKKQFIKRIYNRVIMDELKIEKTDLGNIINLQHDWDVEWFPHPNWFYQISKYLLPSLKHPFIPETRFLKDVKHIPTDLENYVLKPLFSFAGQGVIIDLTKNDIDKITDRENWILQRKVEYASCIETPDGNAKAEIRMMYLWREGDENPTLVTNLARLSKGKMIGTRYNKDKQWVGGSVAYFKK